MNWGGAWAVKAIGGDVYLVIPLALGKPKTKAQGSTKAKRETLVKDVWAQFGEAVVYIGRQVRNQPEVKGILLDVGYDEQRALFGVESHVETKIEMQCVPGTRTEYVYDACARKETHTYTTFDGYTRTESRCVGGTVPRQVYDPCLSKVPVSKSEVVIDPQAMTMRAQSHLQYVVPSSLLGKKASADQLYGKIGILLTDKEGTRLKSQGPVPQALLGP